MTGSRTLSHSVIAAQLSPFFFKSHVPLSNAMASETAHLIAVPTSPATVPAQAATASPEELNTAETTTWHTNETANDDILDAGTAAPPEVGGADDDDATAAATPGWIGEDPAGLGEQTVEGGGEGAVPVSAAVRVQAIEAAVAAERGNVDVHVPEPETPEPEVEIPAHNKPAGKFNPMAEKMKTAAATTAAGMAEVRQGWKNNIAPGLTSGGARVASFFGAVGVKMKE